MEMKTESISMNVRKMHSASVCAKKAVYTGLRITDGDGNRSYQREVLKKHGELLGDPDAGDAISRFVMDNQKREWYQSDVQYELLSKEEAAYHKRLASFFVGSKRVASNVTYSLAIPQIEFGGNFVNEVYDRVSAVVQEEDESYTALIISSGTSQYTKRGRKLERRPEYAPEALGAYLGLSERYGRGLRVSLVYLKRDKDKPDSPFVSSKQILDVDFSKEERNDLLERLIHALQIREEPDCEKCRYETICKGFDFGRKEESGRVVMTGKNPRFTDSQKKVIDFTDGSCAVYAVPGAGKTTTLVYRMEALLKKGVDPKSILFVTFTNKAADEIRDRVSSLLQTDCESDLPDIFTYNGLGWQILRDHPEYVGNLKLLTKLDEKLLLLKCLDAYQKPLDGFSYRYVEGDYGILNLLQKTIAGLQRDEEKTTIELKEKNRSIDQIKELVCLYEGFLKEESYISYDEQITLARDLLKEYPDVLRQYADRWSYIMCDEFQDSSQDNVDLIYMIANAGQKNLVVVGDADQSIYEWRDGSPKHLLQFKDYFPEAVSIQMNDNFRSGRQILDASNRLISQNIDRIELQMVSHREGKAQPWRVKNAFPDYVPMLLDILKQKNLQLGDVAILARSNKPLTDIKKILGERGIDSLSPADYLIKDSFFIVAKDILGMFVEGFERNDLRFYRYLSARGIEAPRKTDPDKTIYENMVMNHGLIPIDTKDMDSMLEYAVEQESKRDPLYDTSKDLFRLFLKLEGKPKVEEIICSIADVLRIEAESEPVRALCDCASQQNITSAEELWDYMCMMETFSDDRKIEYDISPEKVNLLTAHASKGKEFPAVIILWAEDFHPSEEERRLLYVAMTRAKQLLFILESPSACCEMLNDIDGYFTTISCQ